jgi:hypothetical protein
MQGEQVMTLTVFRLSDCRPVVVLLGFLSMLAAILSSYPILMIFIVLIVSISMYFALKLELFKVTNVNLISIIFPAGKVRLDCDSEGIIEGVLSGEQWCTRHAAVLRIVSKQGGVRNLLVLSGQQETADDFRRLHTWLRLGADKRERQRQLLAG